MLVFINYFITHTVIYNVVLTGKPLNKLRQTFCCLPQCFPAHGRHIFEIWSSHSVTDVDVTPHRLAHSYRRRVRACRLCHYGNPRRKIAAITSQIRAWPLPPIFFHFRSSPLIVSFSAILHIQWSIALDIRLLTHEAEGSIFFGGFYYTRRSVKIQRNEIDAILSKEMNRGGILWVQFRR